MAKKAAVTTRKKAERKPKAKKDPNAPKRAQSAYFLFSNEKRTEFRGKFPDLKITDISKKLSEAWKTMTDADKKVRNLSSYVRSNFIQPFNEKAVKDKERYEREKAAYLKKKEEEESSEEKSNNEGSDDEEDDD